MRFCDIKMSRGKKIEETEAFIEVWQTEESLWNVLIPTYKDRNIKKESLKRLAQFL